MDTDDRWLELTAALAREEAADARQEAHDLFVVEASRSRLCDRSGAVRITLNCGRAIDGVLVPGTDGIDGYLTVRRAGMADLHVRAASVVVMTGSRPGLRPESGPEPRSLGSWLRECWDADARVTALTGADRWIAGRVVLVASDYVVLAEVGEEHVLPYGTVEAWSAR